MRKYIVWTTTTRIENGKTVMAASSFEARRKFALIWGLAVTDVMARWTA